MLYLNKTLEIKKKTPITNFGYFKYNYNYFLETYLRFLRTTKSRTVKSKNNGDR